jgi:nitrogenase molybdenum-cofactor synthesis protein NifE
MKILCLDTAGFRGDYFVGVNLALKTIVEGMMEDDGEKTSDSVNIVGEFAGGPELQALKEALKAAGVSVNCVLTAEATLEELRDAPQAACNLLVSTEVGSLAARLMEDRFGLPHAVDFMPFGVDGTRDWVMMAAEHLGVGPSAHDGLEAPYKRAKADIDEMRHALRGKRVGIVTTSDRALGICRFVLGELEMEPVLIGLTNADRPSFEKLRGLLDGHDLAPEMYVQADLFEIEEALPFADLDILLCSEGERNIAYENSVPIVPVSYPMMLGTTYFRHTIYRDTPGRMTLLGFQGAVNLTARMVREIEEPIIPFGSAASHTGWR